LALALKELFHSDVPVQVIGSRHGEKLHETLATAEELCRSEDMGDYWRVHLDDRDLNYDKYFTEGNTDTIRQSDYTSANAQRLSVGEVQAVLAVLPEVKRELEGASGTTGAFAHGS
jgi:UDP-glucose 4-epimerase